MFHGRRSCSSSANESGSVPLIVPVGILHLPGRDQNEVDDVQSSVWRCGPVVPRMLPLRYFAAAGTS
jgi:hypothetical protein